MYLLWLVGVGQRYHHPDDVQVVEGSAGGEGAGQDGRLASGHLDAALGRRHVQRPHAHCGRERRRRSATRVHSRKAGTATGGYRNAASTISIGCTVHNPALLSFLQCIGLRKTL